MFDTVLFDLDGTLLRMDNKAFETSYMRSLAASVASIIDPEHFIRSLWEATYKMVENDGTKTNEAVFYDAFKLKVNDKFEALIPVIDTYYHTGFEAARDSIQASEAMIEAVAILKEKGIQMIVATNPMFPQIAVERRLIWGGLNWSDFSHITHFEICHYCKPNPNYYEEIKQVCGLVPESCLMVGNDAQEDMVASRVGFNTYLIEDELIHRGGEINADYRGSRLDFLEFVKSL